MRRILQETVNSYWVWIQHSNPSLHCSQLSCWKTHWWGSWPSLLHHHSSRYVIFVFKKRFENWTKQINLRQAAQEVIMSLCLLACLFACLSPCLFSCQLCTFALCTIAPLHICTFAPWHHGILAPWLVVVGGWWWWWWWPPSPPWKWRGPYLVIRVVPHLMGERGWVSCQSSGSLAEVIEDTKGCFCSWEISVFERFLLLFCFLIYVWEIS